jgi:hypothetical protein
MDPTDFNLKAVFQFLLGVSKTMKISLIVEEGGSYNIEASSSATIFWLDQGGNRMNSLLFKLTTMVTV